MTPFLLFAHAGISLALLAWARLASRSKAAAVRTSSIAGTVLALWLMAAAGPGLSWRGTTLEATAAVVAATAVAVAWVLVGVVDRGACRWDAAAFIGVASTGLLLAATSRWAVPALLFWFVSSLALAALYADHPRRSRIYSALFAADAAFAGGLIAHVDRWDAWTLPVPATGVALYLILGATALRAGAVPYLHAWGTLHTYSVAALPLFTGGAFVLLAGPAGASVSWAAAGFLAVAATSAVLAVTRPAASIVLAGRWTATLFAGVAVAVPGEVTRAAVLASVAVGVVALWPWSLSRATVARGLMLSVVPIAGGFVLLSASITRGFVAALGPDVTVSSVGWAFVAALALTALAAGVAIGVHAALDRSPSPFEPAAVVATWLLFAVSVAVGIGDGQGRLVALELVAAGLGAGAGWAAYRGGRVIEVGADPLRPRRFEAPAPAPLPGGDRLVWPAACLGIAAATGVVALTVAGLRVGFL